MVKIDASPAKQFFVRMLTRDIDLQDAILDLLDNCVDGVLRSNKSIMSDKPYEGFNAIINISENKFEIKDNCGGIPLEIAQEYAFRMGKPDNRDLSSNDGTIGLYGIGMKRALFKMGTKINIHSNTEKESFNVGINDEWLQNDEWELEMELSSSKPDLLGTTITVESLYNNIKREFGYKNFVRNLISAVSKQYSLIIHKGFSVTINDTIVKPKDIMFIYTDTPDEQNILPYIYKGEIDGVDVDLRVGIYRETPSDEELDNEQIMKRTAEESGWTIICNDRVVLYNDRSLLTGWGEFDVPAFHNQFIGINGVVHFKSNDVSKLPINTTKRGIEASSNVYLHTKKYMREGIKTFTNYTNKAKKDRKKESKLLNNFSKKVIFNKFDLDIIPDDKITKIREKTYEKNAIKFKPVLPVPQNEVSMKLISFYENIKDIEEVGEYFFGSSQYSRSDVGKKCFDATIKKIREGEDI
jgi:hypothetical protein